MILVINYDKKIHILEDLTQKAMGFPNFLLLAHLLTRQKKKKKSLVNYSYNTWNP
jgi:hypothetical protein